MNGFKVIEENTYGVLVEAEAPKCKRCKIDKEDVSVCLSIRCTGGRYLTQTEEQEYYAAKHV